MENTSNTPEQNNALLSEEEKARARDRKGCLGCLGIVILISCLSYFLLPSVFSPQEQGEALPPRPEERPQVPKETPQPVNTISKVDYLGEGKATLHQASGQQWQQASYHNKFNTCVDLFHQQGVEANKQDVQELVKQIETFYRKTGFLSEQVNSIGKLYIKKRKE